jgi:uncharacterized membrane protein
MQRQMATIGFVVALLIAVALVFEVYQAYQQIMQEIRYQQFMFPYDQPKVSPQYQNMASFVVMHAIAAAVLIVVSLGTMASASPAKGRWLMYAIVAGFGLVAGFGASKALFGVAILVGVVSVLSPAPHAVSTGATQSTDSSTSIVAEIERLEGLLQRGLIDQTEFQQLKSKILRRGE